MDQDNRPKNLDPPTIEQPRYYGKYHGRVIDTKDPLNLARIKVEVPALPFTKPPNWAKPCMPYAGDKVGWYFLPPIGANVWVEFEGGDPTYPIWSGCFWDDKSQVPQQGPSQEIKILKTQAFTLTLDDTKDKGSLHLVCDKSAVKTEIDVLCDAKGMTITIKPAKITINPKQGITIDYPKGKITMTDSAVKTEFSSSSITMNSNSIKANTTTTTITSKTNNKGNVNITGKLAVM